MKTLIGISLISGLFAVGCTPVEPPKTPAERHARISEAANLAFDRCGQFMMGGFSAATEMRRTRDEQRQLAIQAGADGAMFEAQKAAITSAYDNQVIWTNPQQACNSLITNIAREA
ncbi:hypothetical protein E4L95_01935 [Paracoccus liaowanqingii]|uniref:Lipoprotein n=1 Tax=Paracoccus liaowanqingii TaxID=2560053 RepID=A0A4Z1CSB2_9RHOB|nr:hypothetical protein [Paracoccus liaowanqingii]TGN68271.1 hypothetical protein E4L95_01935 [Paracoccus liaowanqingii]